MKETEAFLEKMGITPTPVRKLVYHCLKNSGGALSLSDLEERLNTIDKSTISRTLNLFKEKHLLHSFNDGSGSMKYEVCTSHGDHHDDLHVHFRCLECGETICLLGLEVPVVELPSGYRVKEVSYVVTGVCAKCAANGETRI